MLQPSMPPSFQTVSNVALWVSMASVLRATTPIGTVDVLNQPLWELTLTIVVVVLNVPRALPRPDRSTSVEMLLSYILEIRLLEKPRESKIQFSCPLNSIYLGICEKART